MAEAFVELGAEAVNHLTENYYDAAYDKVSGKRKGKQSGKGGDENYYSQDKVRVTQSQNENVSTTGQSQRARRQKNRLPSPEGNFNSRDKQNHPDRDITDDYNRNRRDDSLERESQTSEQVIRAYRSERDDPRRKAETVLSNKDLRKLRRDSRMSYANGYGPPQGSTLGPGGDGGRRESQSQQPPRNRYYDDDEESDYDERTGRRYKSSGRGYDDGYDDRGYDREPARPGYDDRRSSYGAKSDYAAGAGAGALTRYNRDGTVVDGGRSRSRGRRYDDRYDRSRSRSYSGSRSRSRSGGNRDRGIGGKLQGAFDTSPKGLGVGLAGAVVGGLAGREFGHKHKERDVIIGALIGGLGANFAENKYKHHKEEKEGRLRDEEKYYDGRSRSAMR